MVAPPVIRLLRGSSDLADSLLHKFRTRFHHSMSTSSPSNNHGTGSGENCQQSAVSYHVRHRGPAVLPNTTDVFLARSFEYPNRPNVVLADWSSRGYDRYSIEPLCLRAMNGYLFFAFLHKFIYGAMASNLCSNRVFSMGRINLCL